MINGRTFDDFGINNPLGAHAKSVCAGYYSIPTIPSFQLSKLNHIFLATMFKTEDLSKFGNENALAPLISDLQILEEDGIFVKNNGQEHKIYFTLALILGDSLGLNGMLGFTKSFNANLFCRLCKRTSTETKTDLKEHSESLRTISGYVNDLKTPLNIRLKQTGI